MEVEIVVQRNARPAVVPCEIQNFRVFSPLEAGLTSVNRVPPYQPKQRRRSRSEALVQ